MPTVAGGGINLRSTPEARRDGATLTAKTDHRVGAAQLSVRYVFSRDVRALPYVARNRNVPDSGLATRDTGQTVAAGLTHAWSTRVFHRLRAGGTWSRRDNLAGGRDSDGLAALDGNVAVRVSGTVNKLMAASVRFGPRGMVRRMAGGMQKVRGK